MDLPAGAGIIKFFNLNNFLFSFNGRSSNNGKAGAKKMYKTNRYKKHKNIKYELIKNSVKKNRKRKLNNISITLKENFFNVKYYMNEISNQYYYTNHYYLNNKNDLYLFDKELFNIKNHNDIIKY